MRTGVSTVAGFLMMPAAAFAAGADRDGDGRITRAELVAVHALLFDQFDTNHDGVVAGAEADPHFLELADQNGDGKVTRAENQLYAAEAAGQDLANCDANGDDALTGDEIACITSSDSFE
jgi:EF hand